MAPTMTNVPPLVRGTPAAGGNVHARFEALSEKPRRVRTAAAKGICSMAMAKGGAVEEPARPVVRDGGDLKAGLIRGASLVTRGEALGHGLWLDQKFIASVAAAAGPQAAPRGVKARFTHPGISGDGLGRFLGRSRAARLSSDSRKVLADIHFSDTAHRTPDGDLAAYVMDLADEDPDAFAMSIVFYEDVQAEIDFLLANGAVEAHDEEYGDYIDISNFKSPDADNVNNLPHARLAELAAADVVDEPAANPDGLFHREQAFAQEADALAAYALGLGEAAAPALTAFASLDPDRVKGFVGRFLDSHNLKLVSKETAMSQEQQTPPADQTPDAPAASAEEAPAPPAQPPVEQPTADATMPPAEPAPVEPPAKEPEQPQQPVDNARAECKRFIDSFGSQGGTWFAEGLSFEAAQAKYLQQLKEENEALKGRLAAVAEKAGEAEALSVKPAGRDDQPKKGLSDCIKIAGRQS